MSAPPALQAAKLNAYYGQSHILRNLDFHVMADETVSLLGRNGMGKTTLLRTLVGLVRARSGRIQLHGADIAGTRTSAIAKAGLAFVPEGRGIFPNLTVEENLTFAARRGRNGRQGWTLARIYAMFPRLAERRSHWGNELSGGEQKMLAIGRTLMGNPAAILLDEPSEGIAPLLARQLADTIAALRREGVGVLLCEQNAAFARRVADRAYLIERGQIREGELPG